MAATLYDRGTLLSVFQWIHQQKPMCYLLVVEANTSIGATSPTLVNSIYFFTTQEKLVENKHTFTDVRWQDASGNEQLTATITTDFFQSNNIELKTGVYTITFLSPRGGTLPSTLITLPPPQPSIKPQTIIPTQPPVRNLSEPTQSTERLDESAIVIYDSVHDKQIKIPKITTVNFTTVTYDMNWLIQR